MHSILSLTLTAALLACTATAQGPGDTPGPAPTLATGSPSEQAAPPGVGVLPFTNGGSYGQDAEDFAALQVGLQQILITELSQNSEMRVVDRTQLRELMAEQEIPMDRVDAETAVRLGKIVGARYMVMGGFVDWYGDFRLDARIVDTETTEVLQADRIQGSRAGMLTMVVDLAARITESADLPPLPEPVRESRQSSEIPPEAVTLFSHAMVSRDLGMEDESEAMLRQLTEEFPEFVQAREALEQGAG